MGQQHVTDLAISPVLKDSFNVERLTDKSFATGQAFRFDGHQVLLAERGDGLLTVGDELVSLSDSSLVLLAKGSIYSFEENNVTGYLLQFGDCFWEKTPASASNCKAVLFHSDRSSSRLPLNAPDAAVLQQLFETVLDEFESADYPNKPDALAAYLKIMIIKIANIYSLLGEDTGSYDNRIYQDFMALVDAEGHVIHDVAAFAKKLGVSSRKLSDTCTHFGAGAKEIISKKIISEAKRNLQFSSRAIKEISGDLNFSTPYQFSNFFKKHTRLSPQEYRQQFVKIGI